MGKYRRQAVALIVTIGCLLLLDPKAPRLDADLSNFDSYAFWIKFDSAVRYFFAIAVGAMIARRSMVVPAILIAAAFWLGTVYILYGIALPAGPVDWNRLLLGNLDGLAMSVIAGVLGALVGRWFYRVAIRGRRSSPITNLGLCLLVGLSVMQGESASAQHAIPHADAKECGDGRCRDGVPYRSEPGTIAIAATGPRAGEAVFRALQAAEKISSGSIGGVAWFYAMTADGKIHQVSNYGRGGTATLFILGEKTGVPPPPELAQATVAGVVSTGPREPWLDEYDGPHPWFGDGIGFVIGHRLPDAIGIDGLPVDHAVFRLMREGLSAREAVDQVMSRNPRVDAGLLAVAANGEVAMHNSKLVDARPDYGRARGEDIPSGAVVETILNEIHPPQAVAQLVVDKALEVMSDSRSPDIEITVRAGLEVQHGGENLVEVDDRLEAQRVVTTEATYLDGEQWAVVPYIGSRVVQGGRTIGYTVNEPLAQLESGRIMSLSTQEQMQLSVKKTPRTCSLVTPYRTVCRAQQPPIP